MNKIRYEPCILLYTTGVKKAILHDYEGCSTYQLRIGMKNEAGAIHLTDVREQ